MRVQSTWIGLSLMASIGGYKLSTVQMVTHVHMLA